MAEFAWSGAEAYDRYMGRWSRLAAGSFLAWLNAPAQLEWVDVGCGTGALSAAILERAAPSGVRGYDLSPHYVTAARRLAADARAGFAVADGAALPERTSGCALAVSGLMANFVSEPARLITELRRVVRPAGTVALYVWDYQDGMQFLRTFWDAAVALDPGAEALDEGKRFPLCRPEALRALFTEGGLTGVTVEALDVPTRFESFADYWVPFEGGQGPAPGYLAALGVPARDRLKAEVARRLPRAPDGSIRLSARAWAARGTV